MPVYVNESLLVKVHDTNPLFPFHVGVLFPKCPDANVPRVQTLSKQPLITTRPLSHVHAHYLTLGTFLPHVLRPPLDLACTIFVMVLRSRN